MYEVCSRGSRVDDYAVCDKQQRNKLRNIHTLSRCPKRDAGDSTCILTAGFVPDLYENILAGCFSGVV